MRGEHRLLHRVWSSAPAEVYRSAETPDAVVRRFQAATLPDTLRNVLSEDYAILMKRTWRGMRLRVRSFGRRRFPVYAYVRLRACGDHTEVRLTFGYGPLFATFTWMQAVASAACIALAPRAPELLAMGVILLLVLLLLRRLGRHLGFDLRSHLRSFVVSGLRKPSSPELVAP